VRNRITFTPGQVYSTQAITQTQRNLYGFGRFSTVRVQPDQGGDEVVGVKIAVSEGAPREVKLGGGFGVDPTGYEVRGRAGYSIAGWPFPLDTVSLDFRPAYAYLRDGGTYEPRIRALAKLERSDLFWTYAKGEIDAGYNYLTLEAFTSYGPVARVGFETPLGVDKVKLRVGWNFQQVGFRNISSIIDPDLQQRLGIDHTARVAGYQQALIVDLRDHPIEPKLGAYGELHTTEGTAFAGGAYNYLGLMSDLRGYVPLVAGAVLGARARYGAIFGDVPVTERLFSGGSISQRGFGERRLAPSVTGEDTKTGNVVTLPYGGAALIETSLEARVPVTTIRSMPLGVVTFLDGADVTETPGELRPTHLHWAIGLGLRLMTAVGPVRLDFGYRLNRTGDMEPEPGSRYAYHLTIGEAF
jgi:outer membrane protein assembly factor BamA